MNRDRTSAVAIILGAVAFVVTMALHPTAIGVDVHDFGLFVSGYSAWAILIGLQLWRQAPPLPAA